jgi:hypothetical protein
MRSPKKLYVLILVLSLAGYSWLFWNWRIDSGKKEVPVCLFRLATGIPCPSCGTTHSVVSILHGQFFRALKENPLGYPIAAVLLICPLWVAADMVFRRLSFLRFYRSAEGFLRRKWVAIPAVCVVVGIWIVNLLSAG